MNVSAAEPELLFEIEWCNHLARHNHLTQTRRVRFELIDHIARKLVAPRRPVAVFQIVGRELHVNRHHVFACGCERRIAERRNRDIEIRIARKLTILRSVEGALEIVDLRPEVNATGKFYRIVYTTKRWQTIER